jgi:DNA-binding response OmpR family regulator
MPHMNGFDLLEWLRENAIDIPVVIATTDDSANVRELGAAIKLTKPFTLEQLLDGVAGALKRAPAA